MNKFIYRLFCLFVFNKKIEEWTNQCKYDLF